MAMSSLTYILGFSVRFFQPVYSVQLKFEVILTYTKAAMNNQNFIPPFSIFSLAAILVGSRDHRTQIWKKDHMCQEAKRAFAVR
jgi:hypothetical protein